MNEDSNLELISPANHALYGTMCANCELRKEIRLLRWQGQGVNFSTPRKAEDLK